MICPTLISKSSDWSKKKKVNESRSVFHPVPVEGCWKQQFTEYMSETDDQYLKDEVPQSRKDDVHKAFVSSPCNILVKNGQLFLCPVV